MTVREKYSNIDLLEQQLAISAPYMATHIKRCKSQFGDKWCDNFEHTLGIQFGGDPQKIEKAVKAYANFSIEAVLLQKRFSREKKYSAASLDEAVKEVYENQDYMLNYYLPANLLIHYLWPHHYMQLLFVNKYFIKYINDFSGESLLCDVGLGSGFYSRFVLEQCPDLKIEGYDISANSLIYARQQIENFGMSQRWKALKRDICQLNENERFDFAMSVEILEHLVDPVRFLKAIHNRLKPNGKAFVSVAIEAAQRDHIYLYNNSEDVETHLHQAGFDILHNELFEAHEARDGDIVPKLGVFILEKV